MRGGHRVAVHPRTRRYHRCRPVTYRAGRWTAPCGAALDGEWWVSKETTEHHANKHGSTPCRRCFPGTAAV